VSSIRTKSRQLKRKSGLDLVVIDYIGLIKPSEKKGKYSENRVQDISEIARNLKVLARDLGVPVVVISQLNRSVEAREDHRPFLSDLKESGEIEQSADLVLLLFREEYYESRKEPPENTDKHREWQENMDKIRNVAELIVAKNRNGLVGTVKLFFDSGFTRFGNLDRRHDENLDKTQEKKTSTCADMTDKRRWGN
jgi:replicative DNA helicase